MAQSEYQNEKKVADAFAKKLEAPLHIVTRNDEYVFERVLSYGGPCGRDFGMNIELFVPCANSGMIV